MAPRSKTVTFRQSDSREFFFGTEQPPVFYTINGKEELAVSEGHPYHMLGETSDDIGGQFMVIKHTGYSESSNSERRWYSNTSDDPYTGWFIFDGPQYAYAAGLEPLYWPQPHFSSPTQLASYGSTAISRCIPTNPLAGLTVALGELKAEGIPSLAGASFLKDRTRVARNAGSEYLNYQFGWLPLVSDIQDIANSARRSNELVAEYARNSGKRLKRRYSFPVVTESSTETVAEGIEALPKPQLPNISLYLSCEPRVERTRTIESKRWFSGCFTYYLPSHDGLARSAAIADKLYGARITPETLWNLTPWSWAADWIGNFGDVVHNVSRFMNDGLVMPYGYIMEETSTTDLYTATGTRYKSYPGEDPFTCTQSFTTIVKQRAQATPFGFGLDFAGFTQRQWSILAALGLTRGGGRAGH